MTLGTLWLAFEPDRDRQVTLKISHPVQACGEDLRTGSRRLEAAVLRALQLDPAHRHSSAAELAAELASSCDSLAKGRSQGAVG